MNKQFSLLGLILLSSLFAFGQDNNESKIWYQKVEFAAVKEDSLSDGYEEVDMALIRYYEESSILEAEDSEGDVYRWILLKNVDSEFDDSGLQEDGSTRYYYEVEYMGDGSKFLLELIENSESATWILYHGNENGRITVFSAKKLN